MKLIRFLFIVTIIFSQDSILAINKIDSLQTILKNDSIELKDKIDTYNRLSDLFSQENNTDDGLIYAHKAYGLAQENNYFSGASTALDNFFRNYMQACYYDSAFSVVQKLLKIYISNDRKDQMAVQYSRLGAIYSKWGFIEKAMDYYLTALKLSKYSKDNEFKAYLYNNIGMTYTNMKQPKVAITFFDKALKLAEKMPNDLALLTYTYDNLGAYYEVNNDFNNALAYYDKSIVFKKEINDLPNIILSYINIASVNISKGDFQAANSYLNKVLSFHPDTFDRPLLNIQINHQFGKLYFNLGNYNQAILYYKKAIQNYKKIHSVQLLDEIYHELANVYSAFGKDQLATAYLNKTINLRDSIYTAKTQQIIAEVRAIYNFDRNIKDIKLLKKDDEISLLNSKHLKNILIFLSVFSLLLLVLLFLLLRIYKKNKKLILSIVEKNEEVNKINLALVENTNQLELKVNEKTFYLEEEIKKKEEVAKALEASLEKLKDTNQAKDNFIENLQYEIRTPLNSIVGLVDIFKNSKNIKTKELNEILEGIEKSSERLLAIFYNILDITTIQTDDIRIFFYPEDINNLVNIVYQINQYKATQKHINFEFIKNDVDNVFIDKKYLSKAIYNIIDNAIKYTDVGFVRIETKAYDSHYVLVEISDSGKGISPIIIKKLFEKKLIKQNKNAFGTGFALSVKLIELMEGKLEISSKENQGTIVSIFVPIYNQEKQVESDFELSDKAIDKNENKILIIEDDEFNNVLLADIVRDVAIVHSVFSGNDALKHIEDSINKGIVYDLVLLDIYLPDGFNGIELLEKIRKTWTEYQGIPFIAVTAYANEEDKISFLKKGFSDYYIKPFNNRELLKKIIFKLNF